VAAAEVEAMTAEAGQIVDEAEQTGRNARAEAEGRLEGVRLLELRAAQHAGRLRQVALAEASAARLQARDEIVRMLSTARDERRRADTEAAATRERLVRDAATRAASLLAEVEALEHRRDSLRAEVALLAEPTGRSTSDRLDVHLRQFLERLRWRSRSLRAP
jgi:hypothetical protein